MAWTAHRPARVRQKICGADFPPCWHGCRGPLVWTNSLFRQALDCKSSRLIDSTCCRFCRLPTLPISPALPNQPTLSRGLPLPQCLNQRCFVSVSPGRIFLPGLDSPSSSPCSSKNLRCRFSPTSPQLHKSAQPIFPVGGSHATAPMSRPAVFFVKPWTAQSRDPGNAAGPHPSLRDAVPLEGLGGGRIGATWG